MFVKSTVKCERDRIPILGKIIPILGFHRPVKMGITCLKESLFRTKLLKKGNKSEGLICNS
jgi:hypothetical protein